MKLSDGQIAISGNIIIRQRGSKFMAGEGVKMGKDDTIYAVKSGKVKFSTHKKTGYDGNRRIVKIVSVVVV